MAISLSKVVIKHNPASAKLINRRLQTLCMKLSYFLNINRRIVCQLSNDVITVRVARAHASPGFQNACATTLSQSIVQYILYRVRWNIHLRRINKKYIFPNSRPTKASRCLFQAACCLVPSLWRCCHLMMDQISRQSSPVS